MMLETTKYLGFTDVSDMDMPFFEMTNGVLSLHAISSLTEHESNLFKKLIALRFDNDQKSSTLLKDSWFENLIDYYMMHLDGFKKPKSVEVLKRFFHKNLQIEWI
jgi:DNA repair protein RecO (recombination protein O)